LAKEKSRVSPFIYAVLEQAGGGPLVATLTGNVAYELVGPRVLVLDGGAASRTVTLPDAEANHNGDKWVVRNSGSGGFLLVIQDESANSIVTLANGDEATIRNARGVYAVSVVQGTTSGSETETTATVGGRITSSQYNDDIITAAQAANVYIPFYLNCPLPAGSVTGGTRLSMLASIIVDDAAAGTETLKAKLTIGPRYDVWQVVIDTATDEEAYGLDMLFPAAADAVYTSLVDTTVAAIADGLAAAWNADATCAAAATAVSDGVDTVTITSITDQWLKIAEDENAAKMTTTLEVDSGAVTLIETTAVDQAEDDFQALDFELNSPESPNATAELSGIGTWLTSTGGTLANGATVLLPTDFDTTSDLILRVWTKWSATAADTSSRMPFFTVRSE
jgi:hypothetical protein